MPSKPLVDFSRINVENILFDSDAILEAIPHRHEMVQIDRIVDFNPEEGFTVGIKEVGEDEFWIRGHIPGRPILPGVLLLEASAQLCTFHFRKAVDPDPAKFFGFAGINGVKFRGIAVPGDAVVFAVKLMKCKRNIAVFAAQAFVGGSMIFEAEIMGSSV